MPTVRRTPATADMLDDAVAEAEKKGVVVGWSAAVNANGVSEWVVVYTSKTARKPRTETRGSGK